jgi:diaminopimelate decarboxylase
VVERLELFPVSAGVDGSELTIGDARASALAEEFGTPLVVYCEQTLRERAREYRDAAPEALVVYGTKAFPNVAVMRLLAEEGLGADVSTLGELAYAAEAQVPAERLVVHGNNKSDEELQAAAEAGAGLVVLDALDEIEHAAAAGVRRVLVRVTPGIEARTHDAIKTAQHGSKFGLPPAAAIEAVRATGDAGLDAAGLHLHIGSQLVDTAAAETAIDWLADFAGECRSELHWSPAVVNLGGGLGINYVEDEPAPRPRDFVRTLLGQLVRAWQAHDLPRPSLVLESGRSLVGEGACTLYRVGVVKEATPERTWVAIDGGMSDNPRPQLYGARYTALLANRVDAQPEGDFSVCGKHCESGDVLIDRVALPRPRRGDVLAVPATGAYTLGMGSNYNGVPRPAAILVADGEARLIRRRETIEDLLSLEAG